MNIQDWLPLGWTGLISLLSKGLLKSLLQHHSSKASILRRLAFLMVQLSHSYMTTGKTTALTKENFVDNVISLIFYLGLSLEKAMAPHSSTLAWRILWTEEPGGLQSMGSLRIRDDWATSFSLFTFMHWRRRRQSTPVFVPGESHGWGSLVGCYLWGHTESDTTEVT